jgi:hypothetical protein
MSANSKQQICESCKGKYSADLAFCPYCHHKSNLKQHVQGVRYTVEQERTIIGAVGGVLLGAACLLAVWVFKYQGADIEYRVLGRKDFKLTVETRVDRLDGRGLRLAGLTTYWSKPGRLRLDLVSGQDSVGRPVTRLARLGENEMYTVDTAAGIGFIQSYSPEAMQAPVIGGSASVGMAAPGAWTPTSRTQPMFSLLGNFQPGGQMSQAQLVQAPVKTPEVPTWPARSYKLENLGWETLNGLSTIHYRLTTSVSSRGCAGLGDGREVSEYWVVPNLNGRFFEEEPAAASSGSSSSGSPGSNWDDEKAGPTPTPAPNAEPAPTPTPLPAAGTPKTNPTPLPIPTPYSPATQISNLRPVLALVPTPPDACAVGNLRSGDEADFQNLFKGMILKLRQYNGKTLVLEQKVRKFRRLQLGDEVFSADHYTMLDAANFWAKRAEPLPNPTTSKSASGTTAKSP